MRSEKKRNGRDVKKEREVIMHTSSKKVWINLREKAKIRLGNVRMLWLRERHALYSFLPTLVLIHTRKNMQTHKERRILQDTGLASV